MEGGRVTINGENEGAAWEGDKPGRTILAADGRVLMFSCDRFVSDIVQGDCCFVCGAPAGSKPFNDEHIIPKWVLRRFQLFGKTIKLPTGELRKYDRYKVPCCTDCNSLLGRTVETPISELLSNQYVVVVERLRQTGPQLLFVWLSLLFFKIHLKDRSVTLQKNPTLGTEVIGDMYDWPSFHHVHAVARSTFTGARLTKGVVGSLRVYPIEDGLHQDAFDYCSFSFEQIIAVRIGAIGIVAALDDGGAAADAWGQDLRAIDSPISTIQLKEIAAMFATASDDLIDRPSFGTATDGKFVEIFAHVPPPRFRDFDPAKFGHALLFALRDIVTVGGIEVGGTRDPEKVASIIAAGKARFLIANGEQLHIDRAQDHEGQ